MICKNAARTQRTWLRIRIRSLLCYTLLWLRYASSAFSEDDDERCSSSYKQACAMMIILCYRTVTYTVHHMYNNFSSVVISESQTVATILILLYTSFSDSINLCKQQWHQSNSHHALVAEQFNYRDVRELSNNWQHHQRFFKYNIQILTLCNAHPPASCSTATQATTHPNPLLANVRSYCGSNICLHVSRCHCLECHKVWR